MEPMGHPKGALTLMAIYLAIVLLIWFSVYATLLARG